MGAMHNVDILGALDGGRVVVTWICGIAWNTESTGNRGTRVFWYQHVHVDSQVVVIEELGKNQRIQRPIQRCAEVTYCCRAEKIRVAQNKRIDALRSVRRTQREDVPAVIIGPRMQLRLFE